MVHSLESNLRPTEAVLTGNSIDDLIKKLVRFHNTRVKIWALIANQYVPENEKQALLKSLEYISKSIVEQSKKVEKI
jgi:hypothetical protein